MPIGNGNLINTDLLPDTFKSRKGYMPIGNGNCIFQPNFPFLVKPVSKGIHADRQWELDMKCMI